MKLIAQMKKSVFGPYFSGLTFRGNIDDWRNVARNFENNEMVIIDIQKLKK